MTWQKIETAPKDGRYILGWADGEYQVVRWLEYFSSYGSGTWILNGTCQHEEWTPEYWQPLDEPPQLTTEKG